MVDTLTAFAMGEASKGKTQKVFDWDKAAARMKATGARTASAGLSGDWEWTGGEILCDGKPVPAGDTYVYLASTWAVPELVIDDDPCVPCWRYRNETCEWDANTYWPASALAILEGE